MKTFAALLMMLGAATAEFEWVGVFAMSDTTHTWSAQKVGGAYADPTMKLVIMPADPPTEATMESQEAAGETMIDGTCTDVPAGGTMKPAAGGTCFKLIFGSGDDTTFTIDSTGLKGATFFAEHVPTEFERDTHYLYDSKKVDIEPVAQESAGGHAGHSHGHGAAAIKCECEARENNWAMNCADMKPVEDAVTYLTDTCTTPEARATDACIVAYHKFQAHHDYCPHDSLPATLEGILHVHEEHYTDCTIHRKYNSAVPNCVAANCDVMADLDAATKYLYANCNTCNTTACITNFRTVLMAHDTCAEDKLPGNLELGLHDFEEKCEAAICNTATAPLDLSTIECPAVATKSPAPRAALALPIVGFAAALLL